MTIMSYYILSEAHGCLTIRKDEHMFKYDTFSYFYFYFNNAMDLDSMQNSDI